MLPPACLLIVEDHPLYREGVLALLQRHAPALRCRTAAAADEALAVLRRHADIDLVLADHHLPGTRDGLALLQAVGLQWPTVARVLTSGSEDPALAAHARRAGLMGYLPKALDLVPWMAALATILSGEPHFPAQPPSAAAGAAPPLTPRQADILERVAAGQASKAIAAELDVTERTVKYHLAEVFARLDATTRAEAVARAGARGWIRLPGRG